jgi:hypothetical protein
MRWWWYCRLVFVGLLCFMASSGVVVFGHLWPPSRDVPIRGSIKKRGNTIEAIYHSFSDLQVVSKRVLINVSQEMKSSTALQE